METHATLEREWAILLAACSLLSPGERAVRLRSLLNPSTDWNALFTLADHHGVQSLLQQALQDLSDCIPAEPMRRLNQSQRTQIHKAMLLSGELIRIVDSLSARGIDVIPHKGLALAEMAYGDVALRKTGDLDLLIRPQDLPCVRDAVRELGYTPHLALSPAEERAYLKSGYEYAFDGEAGPNLLELQWAIQPRFYAVDFDMAGLFARAVTFHVAGQPMRSLSPSDLLLVLSAHAAKHVWERLLWLCDIARLLHRKDLDWPLIGTQARMLGLVRILRVTMLAAHQLLGAPPPSQARDHLPEDPAAQPLLEEIRPHMLDGRVFRTESIAYFRLMIRLRERVRDRTRFLQRLIFTPGPGEWSVVRLPAPLFPLYRVVRLGRLAAKLAR